MAVIDAVAGALIVAGQIPQIKPDVHFVGYGQPQSAASGNVTLPTTPYAGWSLATNDYIIAIAATRDSGQCSMSADWTVLESTLVGSTTDTVSRFVWGHRYTGTFPSSVITHSSGDAIHALWVAYRRVGKVRSVSSGTGYDYGDNTLTCAAPTGLAIGDTALAIAFLAETNAPGFNMGITTGWGATWTERYEGGTLLGDNTGLGVYEGLVADATGSLVLDAYTMADADHGYAVLALAPGVFREPGTGALVLTGSLPFGNVNLPRLYDDGPANVGENPCGYSRFHVWCQWATET